jgi:alpha-acetolactate decarboxylase
MRSIYYFVTALFVCILVACTASSSTLNFQHYGNFANAIKQNDLDGVVDISTALLSPHTYAVGAIADGKGEITTIDSKVFLSYGKNGLGRAINNIPAKEKAFLLVTAQVNDWQKITIPEDMSESELYKFILTQSHKARPNSNSSFPFLLEGNFQNLTWHITNGRNAEFRGHGSEKPFFNLLTRQQEQTDAQIVGFYSAETQGVFTHPGTSWHLHTIFSDENKAGHVDSVSVRRNTTLKLPV